MIKYSYKVYETFIEVFYYLIIFLFIKLKYIYQPHSGSSLSKDLLCAFEIPYDSLTVQYKYI